MGTESAFDANIKNVKTAFDELLKADTTIKRRKKTALDQERVEFIKMVTSLDALDKRTNLIAIALDLTEYEKPFYEIIDMLIGRLYSKSALNLIYYYIYERMNPDGSVNYLQGPDGNPFTITSPEQLWEIININPDI